VGRWLIAIARENGDHVKTLVRDRRKLPPDMGAIGIVEGDVRDREAVAAVIGGCDVVFSALGSGRLGRTTLYSAGTANIIAAMRAARLARFLAISSVGVEDDPNATALARRVLFPYLLHNVLADMRTMEKNILESYLAWTIVRPARLTNGPRTGTYRTNDRLVPANGRKISRADVADYMYRSAIDERTIGKVVALAY